VTFGVVRHRVSSGRELLTVAPALQSSEQSALHAAIPFEPVVRKNSIAGLQLNVTHCYILSPG